jgi:signal transduction histidine kinase
VAADAHRLQQVFLNLSLNAFHAMQGGGTLAISVKNRSGAFVQVDFQDQGHGIDPAAVPRIFEPGFTTKAGSPGLGLSVCKKVIEQHGGSIQVQSSTQQGTTFSLLLPLEKGSA